MILKSLSRKGTKRSTVTQLLNYMLQEHKKGDVIITHNIQGNSVEEYTNAFMQNEQQRIHIRNNTVLVYHDIISFHHLDSEKISQKTLRSIAKEYIKLRNPNALYVIIPHHDRNHIHLHVTISGVVLGKANRINRARFKEIKIELQNRFPDLQHSIVVHGKKEKQRISEKEYQLTKRTKQPSKRELLKQTITHAYQNATSRENFFYTLQEQGLTIYQRNGKEQGVISDTIKIRFSNAGITEQQLSELDIVQDFEQLRKDQERNMEMTIGR